MRCSVHMKVADDQKNKMCKSFPSFFFSSRRRHTRFDCDWSSDVCSSDLTLKYSQCDAILLKLRHSNTHFTLQICDNGIGFDSSREFSTNGLQNMKHRAKEIDGLLNITSAPGKGTCVELVVKIT